MNAEDVEPNSTDSSMEFDELHSLQSHASLLRSNSSEIPDFFPLQEELRLSNYSESSHHSELFQSSELVHYSECFDNCECSEHSECSEHFNFERSNNDGYRQGDILHDDPENLLLLLHSPSNSSSSSSNKNSVHGNSKVLKFLHGWALKHNITHKAISDLLHGLKENHECFADESESKFSVDARTLLKTKVKLIKKLLTLAITFTLDCKNNY
ncbi:unnamed protein product [Lasius platythorax]|uniref:Uncharacterized protein n=1 Tax=Lasius platythorax TaxID=488582 RepID=A0AAV2MZQ1_9HYME